MARTNMVKKARRAQGNCRVCGKPINIGDSYKWVKPRYRGKIVACPACTIPMSMTSSSKMAVVYDATASIGRDNPEDVATDLRMIAETAREVGQEYQESAENKQEYFPDDEAAAEWQDWADQLETWADDLGTAADEAESEASELEELEAEKSQLEDGETGEMSEEEVANRLVELEAEIDSKKDDILAHLDEADNCPI